MKTKRCVCSDLPVIYPAETAYSAPFNDMRVDNDQVRFNVYSIIRYNSEIEVFEILSFYNDAIYKFVARSEIKYCPFCGRELKLSRSDNK